MIAEGATPQLILIAVEAIEARDAVAAEVRAKAAERTRRYRQRGGGQVETHVRQYILERDGHQCLECGCQEALEIDHIIPLAKGGHPTDEDNLQTLCRPCNARKRDRIRKGEIRGKLRTESEIHGSPQTTPFPAPPNENNLTPPTHTPVNNTPRARRLPADWIPAPLPSQLLDQVSAWKAGLLESELAKFRDWAASAPDKTGLKKDWDAAWRNWLRRKIEEGPKNGNSGNRQDDGMGRTERAAMQALRELGGDPRPAMRSAGSHAVTRQEPYSLLAIGHVGGGSD